MKLSEIKKSMTVALMAGVAATAENESQNESDVFTDDIRMQCQVVGDHLATEVMDIMLKARSYDPNDIRMQCQAIGDHLATKFLQECMKDAEKCLKDGKRFDELMKEFEKIGPRFSVEIEEEGK
tara:strand:- start:385 stop:756 length:372 start_codon:yes stop_codon:yes gene_type:complete